MEMIRYLFSFLCHQNAVRSFTIDGQALPFCQRCTGIYLGIGLSCIFLLLMRYYKRGFPPYSIIGFNIISLLLMPVFGFHLLDPGPAWRLWSGLVFGNAVVFLLLPGTSILCSKTTYYEPYSCPEKICIVGFIFFINTIPVWFPIQSHWFYHLILFIVFIGLFCIVWCVASLIYVLLNNISLSTIWKGCQNGHSVKSKSSA
jgi:uncharacterized membrane protein